MFSLFKLFEIQNLEKRVDELTKELSHRSTVEYVKQLETTFNRDIKELVKENERLERIIKYSKDIPTYRMETYRTKFTNSLYMQHYTDLHMYIDKEEYVVELPHVKHISFEVRDFDVSDNLATLEIVYSDVTSNSLYTYIIDYKKGTYVHSISKLSDEYKKGETNA